MWGAYKDAPLPLPVTAGLGHYRTPSVTPRSGGDFHRGEQRGLRAFLTPATDPTSTAAASGLAYRSRAKMALHGAGTKDTDAHEMNGVGDARQARWVVAPPASPVHVIRFWIGAALAASDARYGINHRRTAVVLRTRYSAFGYGSRDAVVWLPEVPADAPLISSLGLVAAALGLREEIRYGLSTEVELQRARRLIRALAVATCLPHAVSRRTQQLPTIAQQVFFAFTGKKANPAQHALVDRCLVLSADHELNASAFVARIAAGAGSDLHSCLTAALSTLSGPRHGGACDRVEALMSEVMASTPQKAMTARLARGEDLPGFDVGAYPLGDPRTPPLLDAARRLMRSPRLNAINALAAVVKRELGEAPALDLGLVAAAYALGFPSGAAGGLFAIGRTAGWVAHVLEQRASGQPIRPRARYVGS